MNKPVPVNPPELRSTFVAASAMPWQRTEFDGIEMKILYQDDEGRSTILFKMAPGAVVPLHEHTALEQTYMLEGSLEDAGRRLRRRATSCGGRAATSTSRMRPTGRCSSPCSTGRTGFSTGRSFLRLAENAIAGWVEPFAKPIIFANELSQSACRSRHASRSRTRDSRRPRQRLARDSAGRHGRTSNVRPS